MNLAPIALFTYNRPWHTMQTVAALRKNELADASDLVVYSDGPQNDTARNSVAEVRKYIRAIDGFKSIRIVERENNAGLANAIIAGVSETVGEFGRVIVMEDDLISSPYFLRFMNDALNCYDCEDRVVSIHAYTYPVAETLPETFFLKGADCWGWATWKRGWEVFESDGAKLLEEIKAKKLTKNFDMGGVHPYTKMLKDQTTGKNNSWAIRWYASAFLKNKLTLYPGRCLVHNIGTDSSGTHCESVNYYDVSLADEAIRVGEIDIVENDSARKAFQKYMKSTRRKQVPRSLKRIVEDFFSPQKRLPS
jgi:glycosyltransferase involved in cell wall biosynthesis